MNTTEQVHITFQRSPPRPPQTTSEIIYEIATASDGSADIRRNGKRLYTCPNRQTALNNLYLWTKPGCACWLPDGPTSHLWNNLHNAAHGLPLITRRRWT